VISLVAVLFILGSSTPTAAIPRTFTEDFTSKAYCDTEYTTAWWDTTAGELKLFPFEPAIAGSVTTPGYAQGVCVDGNHAFVADLTSGLQVVRIENPTSPVIIGAVAMPNNAYDVCVAGDRAYVTTSGSYGLQVVDIGDPVNASIIGSALMGPAVSVDIAGDHAFLACGTVGFRAVDITDPTNPSALGALATLDYAHDVWVEGDHAFVADADSGLHVVDITNPASPVIIGSIDTPGTAYEVCVAGDHAYVADNSHLQVVDITDPANPAIVGSVSIPGGAGRAVRVDGDYAYVGGSATGVHVIDISDPTSPAVIHSVDTPGSPLNVDIDGEYAYVADYTGGLQVIEIGLPLTPSPESEPMASVYTPGLSQGVYVAGDYAYVADYTSGLTVVDVSNPASLAIIGSVETIKANDVCVAGDHAYVADDTYGLRVIDVSDPANPAIVGRADSDRALSVCVAGDHAYVADDDGGLQVVDISDPTNPAIVGSVFTPDYAKGVYVSGDHAYVAAWHLAAWQSGLQVVSISDPTNPTVIGSVITPGYAMDVFVAGDCAYVADADSGLQVVDITDPANPVIIGSVITPGTAERLYVAGDRAYVAGLFDYAQIIDIIDPANPAIVGSVGTQFSTEDVHVAGDVAFVVDRSYLELASISSRRFDPNRRIGQSSNLTSSDETVVRTVLTVSATGLTVPQVSADAGSTWTEVPDGYWYRLGAPGNDLRWRAHLNTGFDDPTVESLQLGWLFECTLIDSVRDVPGDQGGWTRIHFPRSGYDFPGEQDYPATGYQIYRRVEDGALLRQVLAGAEVASPQDVEGSPLFICEPLDYRCLGERWFISGTGGAKDEFPPGVWEVVSWVAATQQDEYVALVPTLGDSTAGGIPWATYLVTTHTTTPSVWFVSDPDSGYSIDNIAPAPPANLAFGGPEVLVWDEAPEGDFAYHTVYGSESADFDETATLIDYTVDPTFDVSSSPYAYYHVTTSDYADNESDAASIEGQTTSASVEALLPTRFSLGAARPNPFNPITEISYGIPAGASVSRVVMNVYDATGRQVTTLVDVEQGPGTYGIVWDGTDRSGAEVASGVYFYRISWNGRSERRRMVLLK
jgi:hypothetical protein